MLAPVQHIFTQLVMIRNNSDYRAFVQPARFQRIEKTAQLSVEAMKSLHRVDQLPRLGRVSGKSRGIGRSLVRSMCR